MTRRHRIPRHRLLHDRLRRAHLDREARRHLRRCTVIVGPTPAQGTCLGAMGERGMAAMQRATPLGVLMRNA